MFKKLFSSQKQGSLNSCLGLLGHGNSFKIREKLLKVSANNLPWL